jgi:hypothetical protein
VGPYESQAVLPTDAVANMEMTGRKWNVFFRSWWRKNFGDMVSEREQAENDIWRPAAWGILELTCRFFLFSAAQISLAMESGCFYAKKKNRRCQTQSIR